MHALMHVHVLTAGRESLNCCPVPGYEYRHATWPEVCELGPQGWRLVPVPPIAEMRNVLGQPQVGEPLYAMERETSPEYGAGLEPGPVARMFMPARGYPVEGRKHWVPQDADGPE
jgi:hypothetical protein